MNSKAQLREIVRARRAAMSREEVLTASREIQERLLCMQEFERATTVCCYLSLPCEVQTDLIVKRVWQAEKALCVPASMPNGGCYGLARMTAATRLIEGPAAVLEPSEPDWLDVDNVDLMVVPGVAFDSRGGRVGHGAGHYDRIMETGKRPLFKVGLAFRFQIYDVVPVEVGDVRLDRVIFE